MKMAVLATAMAIGLSGCGTYADNADVPHGIYAGLEGRAEIRDTAPVSVVASGPAVGTGGTTVTGTSCQNKVWEDSPSRDNAIALMKRQAAEQGFNAVHSVNVDEGTLSSLGKNCWASLTATGIAFSEQPATATGSQIAQTRRRQ